jgi:hypothetical protein
MDRFGFAEEKSNGFKLRTAAYRFLDLCREASDLGKNAFDDEERSGAESGPTNATAPPPATFASLDTEEEPSSTDPEAESSGL